LTPVVASRKRRRRWIAGSLALGLVLALVGIASAFGSSSSSTASAEAGVETTTPIKHVVVMFQENESFDHYYGTYPDAKNGTGEPEFTARAGTPEVNGLTKTLLEDNPNGDNPQRLARSEALTCDMDHGYADEQKAYDNGLVDKFPEYTGGTCNNRSMVMDYFDGNTVTGLWNLAQHFALNDNSFDTQFGPSTPGALNLISGETGGAEPATLSGAVENGTVMGDNDPVYDDCGNGGLAMTGRNVGNLLNEKEVTWGWFQGGFAPTGHEGTKAYCESSHANISSTQVRDYSAHHNPFEYYESTSNRHHLLPESEAMIGHSEPDMPERGADHQYDISAFDEAVEHENLPAVSFLKAPEYEDGHPGYSDPLDEQTYIAEKLDELENSNEWESTAVIIAYDDSDGWYDHVMPTIVTPSKSSSDFLTKAGECGHVTNEAAAMDHCGYGPRLPLTVISPYAKENYVDGTLTDQTSILKFIEENWKLGRISSTSADNKAGTLDNMFDFEAGAGKRPKVFLDPKNGEITKIEGGEAPASGSSGEQPSTGTGTGTGTSTGTSTGTATTTSTAKGKPTKKAAKPKAQCAVVGSGKKVKLSCTVKNTSGKTDVRFRLDSGKKVMGTVATTVRSGKANATMKLKKAPRGSYRLVATIDVGGKLTVVEHTIKLPGKDKVSLT
jgi:phospholipase C